MTSQTNTEPREPVTDQALIDAAARIGHRAQNVLMELFTGREHQKYEGDHKIFMRSAAQVAFQDALIRGDDYETSLGRFFEHAEAGPETEMRRKVFAAAYAPMWTFLQQALGLSTGVNDVTGRPVQEALYDTAQIEGGEND